MIRSSLSSTCWESTSMLKDLMKSIKKIEYSLESSYKRVIHLFISILLAGTLVSLPVFGETKFYDRDWNLKYRMDDRGRIYDTDYNLKGRMQGDKVYDKDYNLKYRIKDNKVYDRNWNLEKRIDNDKIYDKNWNLKGRIKR